VDRVGPGIETLADEFAGKIKVGKITQSQVEEIAKIKMPDLNCFTLEAAIKCVEGTARSMGVDVVA
jgi:large subunit ribosomal protein L11